MIRTTEEWVVVWFPPEVPKRQKKCSTEGEAQAYAQDEQVAPWYPLIEHRIVRTEEQSEFVPLRPKKEVD